MRTFLILTLVCLTGCRGTTGNIVVTGSAYVESERPEGKAVAKVEVQYRPAVDPARDTLREPRNVAGKGSASEMKDAVAEIAKPHVAASLRQE
ncbi:MAG: hypothetical protein WCL32_10155 [Planctomycetota bacterium]